MESERRAVPVSGLEVRVLVRELSRMVGWYVSSVHSLGENQVIRMKSADGDADVAASPLYGAWVTAAPAHGTTTEFTTALRQRLVRLKLQGVEQVGVDRVFVFSFADGETVTQLIVELIPPGNVVVADASGMVALVLREQKGPRRTTVRGRPYVPPPRSKFSIEDIDSQTLAQVLASEQTVGKALGRGLSLPRRYVDEVLARSGLTQEEKTPLSPEKGVQVLGALKELIAALDKPSPCVVERDGALELMCIAPRTATVVEYSLSMSPLMDKLFVSRMVREEEPQKDQKAEETEATIRNLERQVAELRESAKVFRRLAEEVRSATSSEDAGALVSGSAVGAHVKEELKKRNSTAAMASLLFDEAKGTEGETTRIEEIVAGLTSRLKRARRVTPKSSVRAVRREHKEWYEKFRWFFTSGKKLAVGGRDAQSNTILVKKHLDQGDVVYHADLFGSPFFVLKGGESQSPEEVRELAQATASFSSAWKTGLSAADSYWVNPDQVSSSAPSGEYLSRGSFAIRGKKNFVPKNPVEVAVGIDSAGRVASGPEQAVLTECTAYVVLIPSRDKSSDTAKKVLAELRKLYNDGTLLELDDVMRALPTGGGKIVRRKERKPSEGAEEPANSGTTLLGDEGPSEQA